MTELVKNGHEVVVQIYRTLTVSKYGFASSPPSAMAAIALIVFDFHARSFDVGCRRRLGPTVCGQCSTQARWLACSARTASLSFKGRLEVDVVGRDAEASRQACCSRCSVQKEGWKRGGWRGNGGKRVRRAQCTTAHLNHECGLSV